MRKLSKKQKSIIIDYVKSGFFEKDWLIKKHGNNVILYKQLEKVNNYETLYQDVERLIDDLLFKDNKEEKIDYIKNFI